MNWILIGVAGIAGVLTRYFVVIRVTSQFWGVPLSVLIVNALGSLLGGFMIGSPWISLKINSVWQMALAVGLLGGFTTFSAVSMDTVRLWQAGQTSSALLNLLLNNVISISTCVLGYKVGSRIL
jgi:CrcB protein